MRSTKDGRRWTRDGRFWFDKEAADRALEFFPRHLCLTKFHFAGKPFDLLRWERRVVRKVIGWKRADGMRRFRRVWIEIPRGNGKTEFGAGLSLCVWIGDGDIGADFYVLATSEDQSRIAFDRATQMVQLSATLRAGIETFKTSLWNSVALAALKPLSARPDTKQGFRPKGFLADEVHIWDDGELAETVHEGEGVTPQPLDIYITTAGERDTYAFHQHDHAMAVLQGEIEDEDLFVAIYGAADDDDWTDPKIWAKANPSFNITVREDFLAGECRKARQNPRLENRFRRFYLNQWVEQSVRWVPMEYWDCCTAAPSAKAQSLFLSDDERDEKLQAIVRSASVDDPDLWKHLPEMLAGKRCAGGLDLATTRDVAAACFWFPREVAGGREILIWKFWLPRDTLKTLKEIDRKRYQHWADIGALTLTPGNVTDYAFVKAGIMAAAKTFRIAAFGIDRWNATQLATDLLNTEGLPVELFGQGFASMSGPSKEFERLFMGLELEHGNHPVARWMAKNVAVDEDPAGNIKPTKERSSGKIDGIVAAIMAKGMLMSKPIETSVYERRGLLKV